MSNDRKDRKEIIKISQNKKDKQYNGEKKKDKTTNNGGLVTTQKKRLSNAESIINMA